MIPVPGAAPTRVRRRTCRLSLAVIREGVLAGMTYEGIAAAHGYSPWQVEARARQHGLTYRALRGDPRRRVPGDERIRLDYEAGMTLAQMGEAYGVSAPAVLKHVKRLYPDRYP